MRRRKRNLARRCRYLPFHASLDLYSRGQYQFTGGIFTGNALANLLLGLPTNALRLTGNTTRDFRTWTSSFYVQHEWQPFRRLSLNAGSAVRLSDAISRSSRSRVELQSGDRPDHEIARAGSTSPTATISVRDLDSPGSRWETLLYGLVMASFTTRSPSATACSCWA